MRDLVQQDASSAGTKCQLTMNKKRTGIIFGCIIAVVIVCFVTYNYWWALTRILIINPLPAQAADIALNNDCSHIRVDGYTIPSKGCSPFYTLLYPKFRE